MGNGRAARELRELGNGRAARELRELGNSKLKTWHMILNEAILNPRIIECIGPDLSGMPAQIIIIITKNFAHQQNLVSIVNAFDNLTQCETHDM